MDRTLIDSAARALDIEAVFLRASAIRCREGFMPQFIEDDLSLIPQFRVGPTGKLHIVTATHQETGDTAKIVMFYVAAGVRLTDGTSGEAEEQQDDVAGDVAYVEIESEFCAQYRLHEGADEEDLRPALEEFGRYNVSYHVWPYWREYVQSVCLRIGIPPIPVPMYQIPQPQPERATAPD